MEALLEVLNVDVGKYVYFSLKKMFTILRKKYIFGAKSIYIFIYFLQIFCIRHKIKYCKTYKILLINKSHRYHNRK